MLRSTGSTPPRTARQAVEVVRPRAGCQAGDGVWAGSGPQRVRTKWTPRRLWVGSGRTTGPGVLSGGAGDGADAGPRAAATGAPRLCLPMSGNALDGVMGGAGPRCAGRGGACPGAAVYEVLELCLQMQVNDLTLRPSQSGQQIKHEWVDQVWTRCGGSRSEPPSLLCDAEKRGHRARLRTVCPARLRPVRHFGGHRGLYWREILLSPHSDMLSALRPRPQPHARSHEPVPAFLSTTRPQREPVGG